MSPVDETFTIVEYSEIIGLSQKGNSPANVGQTAPNDKAIAVAIVQREIFK